MTHFLSNLSHEVITWPSNAEKIEIEHYFRTKGFPGVIGAIDGSHVKIDKPTNDRFLLKQETLFSIQFQVVCDHRRKIREIFVGFPGSVHDSRIFRASPLSGSLPDKCGPFFIIGDSGYPCLPNLLTPFKDFGNLTRRQQHYNLTLSQNRYLVEHYIGILKQKFRQLYHVKLRSIPEITHFIRACCIVHNLCLDDDFPDDALNLTFQRNIEAAYEHERENEGNENRDDVTGIQRRRNVMNMLPL